MRNILHLVLLCAGVAAALAARAFDRPNIQPGPYCGLYQDGLQPTCCRGRSDECSFNINFSGDAGIGRATLCYCDDFCDRGTEDDCCPDYFEVCKNEYQYPARAGAPLLWRRRPRQ